jgi:hypothetical protein
MRIPFVGTPRVFVASTSEDALRRYRDIASTVIRRAGCLAEMHEDWSPDQRKTLEACRQQVERCQALVLIVGDRYGYVVPKEEGGSGESSVTKLEYEHARKKRRRIFAYLVGSGAGAIVAPPEDETKRAALARFRTELSTRLASTAATPLDFEAKLSPAIGQWKNDLLWRDVRVAAASAALLIAATGAAAWLRGSPPADATTARTPDLLTYVRGTVKTPRGLPPGDGTVTLECSQASTPLKRDGGYVFTLTDHPDKCRTLPLAVSVTTSDGRTASGTVTDPNNGDIEVEDAPNRLTASKLLGPALHAVDLESPVGDGRAFTYEQVSAAAPAGSAEPQIFIPQDSGATNGILLAVTTPKTGSVVRLAPASDEALALAVERYGTRFRAGARSGLQTWERALKALHSAGAPAELVSDAFASAADSLQAPDCGTRREAHRWLLTANTIRPTPSLDQKLSDLSLKVSLACLKP